MNTEKKLIPLLRFSAFIGDGEWENVKLGDCLLQTPDYGLNAPAVPYSESLPTYLRITDITDSGKFDKSHLVSVNAELSSENSLQEGDLVVARTGASVGKVYKYRKEDGPLVFAGFLIRLRPNPNRCNSEYLFQYMLSPSYKRWVNITSTRSGQPGINSTEYASLSVPFPQKLPEQQKIADCLSSIDSYISSVNEKIEQLKAHKKSLMQKLFPQNGQTVPEYRFPIFQQNGEWWRKKMKEIITVNSGRDYKHLEAGEIPVYGTGGYMLSVNDKLSDIDAVGIGRKGTIDKPQYLKAPFWTVDTLFFLTSIEGYDIEFVYYLAQNIPWKKYGEQTGVPSLSKLSIENLEVLVPANKAEQKRISTMLSSLDYELFLLEKKLLLLETHKNGLVQQLFPPK